MIDAQRKYEDDSKRADEISKKEKKQPKKANQLYQQRMQKMFYFINLMEDGLSENQFEHKMKQEFWNNVSKKEEYKTYFTDATKRMFRTNYQNKFNRANKH